ncbi:O-methyltransferase gsfB, partial [Lachnellula suecica]
SVSKSSCYSIILCTRTGHRYCAGNLLQQTRMSSRSRIVELAAIIHEQTLKVDAHLASNQIPAPSFDIDTPLSLPAEVQVSQGAVLEAIDELQALFLGPIGSVVPPHNAWTCVTAIQRFGYATSFPTTATSTFAEIAQACGTSESDTRRLLRQAMTFYIFREPSPGVVAHTAGSKVLAEIPSVGAYIDFVSLEMLPSHGRLVDAMQKWPGSEEPNEAGFAVAHNCDIPMFEVIASDPKRAERMVGGMSFLLSSPGFSVNYLLENFEWGSAAKGGLLVDVGGASGEVATAIARHLPEIKCIVQDTPGVIEGAEVPSDLEGRLSFMAHDFFQQQPLKGADIYLIRFVLHDWSDKYAVKILKSLVPSLKRGARVLVSDTCAPPSSGDMSPYQYRAPRTYDIYMKGLANAKERNADEWAQLFKLVDPQFSPCEIQSPEGSVMSIISVTWQGESF